MDEVPITDAAVRGEMFKGHLIRPDESNPNDLRITDISNMDMKGSIPPRLLNMAMSGMMSKGLVDLNSNLRKLQ